ncbi:hypothetical protein A9A59_0415 [Tepidiforma thermophila]|uniref:Uncharacterized protein n=1 Tax=Tepidiforma thermophila (strain KCTC 52669 / CGMCC 1.13589 / G233) TaxID=2761530 RepID=A0A2A9HDM3_TEPT2|nr:hypothetical protein A9A59_0415 [Tepidiforma thermophila]
MVLVVAAAVAGAFIVFRSRDDGGTGSDEAYVRAVCVATKTFGEETERYFSDPELVQDSEKLSKAIAGPLRTYVNRMAAAKPPPDARDYHEAAVRQLRTLLAAAERGEILQALRDFGDTPEPPPEVEARLSAVAESIEECEDINPFD